MKKLLDVMNETTVSGSIAAGPAVGLGTQRRNQDVYSEETDDGTKAPSAPKAKEFGLWKNSVLAGAEQRDRKKSKKSIKENKGLDQSLMEGRFDNPVSNAITRRIIDQRSDLLRFGPSEIMSAIDQVAEWVGDVDEIGSSDISAWVKQVEVLLKTQNGQGVAEAGNKPVDKLGSYFGGDTRTPRELKSQMRDASDKFVNRAATDVGPFHSKVAKMQGKLAKSELRKRADHDRMASGTNEDVTEDLKDPKDNPCWKGYKPVGTKKKGGRTVPNCVPKESVEEDSVEEGVFKDVKRFMTAKDVKSRAGEEVSKALDATMKGDYKTSKKHFNRYDKLDKLTNKNQDVTENNWSHDPWKDKYFGPTAGAMKKIFKIKIQDEDSNVKAFNVKAETEQQAKEIIEKHVPGSNILSVKFVKNLMALEQDVAEGSTGWMLKQDPALAKKVKANTQGYKDLKKFAGKPVPKKDEKGVAEDSERLTRLKAARSQGKSMGDAYSDLKDLEGTTGKPSERAAKLKAARAQGKSIGQAYSSLDDKSDVAEAEETSAPTVNTCKRCGKKWKYEHYCKGTPDKKTGVAEGSLDEEFNNEAAYDGVTSKVGNQLTESSVKFITDLIGEFNTQLSGNDSLPLNYKNTGMRMWTRGDGSRYKDPGSIYINRNLDPKDQAKWNKEKPIEKFWNYLNSKGAKKIGDVSGEFGSDPYNPAVVLNKLVFVYTGRNILWGSTSRLKNSSIWRQKPQGVAEGMKDGVVHPDDPWDEGWYAGHRRGQIVDCPYEKGTPEYKQWNDGYDEAQAQPNHYDESVDVSENANDKDIMPMYKWDKNKNQWVKKSEDEVQSTIARVGQLANQNKKISKVDELDCGAGQRQLKLAEENISEEQLLAKELARRLKLFMKGEDHELGTKSKDRELLSKTTQSTGAMRETSNYGDLDEVAPPGKEDWIKSNKERFKKQYGDKKGTNILYATAWADYNKKHGKK